MILSFREAWEIYHNSFFEDNQNEVLGFDPRDIYEGSSTRSALDLNSTVWLFKELGRPDQAREMLEHFVKMRSGQPELLIFDISLSQIALPTPM